MDKDTGALPSNKHVCQTKQILLQYNTILMGNKCLAETLQITPEIFSWVQVWAISRPVKFLHSRHTIVKYSLPLKDRLYIQNTLNTLCQTDRWRSF